MKINIFLQIFFSFLSTVSFSMIFNVPRKELFFCGIAGSIGWLFYSLILIFIGQDQIIYANFIGSLMVVYVSRILAYSRKTPLLVFLIPGIIPLVPGAGIYYTMFNMINDNNAQALSKGIETLKISGVISISVVIILSLPNKLFTSPFINKKSET